MEASPAKDKSARTPIPWELILEVCHVLENWEALAGMAAHDPPAFRVILNCLMVGAHRKIFETSDFAIHLQVKV
ncbi:MAG: hypothetical protein ACODUE_06375 [Synechococcus sp.]